MTIQFKKELSSWLSKTITGLELFYHQKTGEMPSNYRTQSPDKTVSCIPQLITEIGSYINELELDILKSEKALETYSLEDLETEIKRRNRL